MIRVTFKHWDRPRPETHTIRSLRDLDELLPYPRRADLISVMTLPTKRRPVARGAAPEGKPRAGRGGRSTTA